MVVLDFIHKNNHTIKKNYEHTLTDLACLYIPLPAKVTVVVIVQEPCCVIYTRVKSAKAFIEVVKETAVTAAIAVFLNIFFISLPSFIKVINFHP
jgi:hypothetical protein